MSNTARLAWVVATALAVFVAVAVLVSAVRERLTILEHSEIAEDRPA